MEGRCICEDGTTDDRRCPLKVDKNGAGFFCAKHLSLLLQGERADYYAGVPKNERKAAETIIRSKRPRFWITEALSSTGGTAKLICLLVPPLLFAQAVELSVLEFPRPFLTSSFDSVNLLIGAIPQLLFIVAASLAMMFFFTAVISALLLPGIALLKFMSALKAVGRSVARYCQWMFAAQRSNGISSNLTIDRRSIAAASASADTTPETRAKKILSAADLRWSDAFREVQRINGSILGALFCSARQDRLAYILRSAAYLSFVVLLALTNFSIATLINNRIDCRVSEMKEIGTEKPSEKCAIGSLVSVLLDFVLPTTPGNLIYMRTAKGDPAFVPEPLTLLSETPLATDNIDQSSANIGRKALSSNIVHIGDYGDWAFFARSDGERVLVRRNRIVEFSTTAGAFAANRILDGRSDQMDLLTMILSRIEKIEVTMGPMREALETPPEYHDAIAHIANVKLRIATIEERLAANRVILDDLQYAQGQHDVLTFGNGKKIEDLRALIAKEGSEARSVLLALFALLSGTEANRNSLQIDDAKGLVDQVKRIADLLETHVQLSVEAEANQTTIHKLLGARVSTGFSTYPRNALEAMSLRPNAVSIFSCLLKNSPLERIHFDHGKYESDPDGVKRSADALIRALSEEWSEDAIVFLIGAASPKGPENFNNKLSEKRAEWVQEQLVSSLARYQERASPSTSIARHIFVPFARGEWPDSVEESSGRHVSIVVCNG